MSIIKSFYVNSMNISILTRFYRHHYPYIHYILRVIFIFTFSTLVYLIILSPHVSNYSEHPHYIHLKKLQTLGPSICQIPRLNPWDPTILSYYENPGQYNCKQQQDQLVQSFSNGIIQFDKTKTNGAECVQVEISHNEGVSDSEAYYGNEQSLDLIANSSFKFNNEFFEINCESTGPFKRQLFKYHYAQVIPKMNIKPSSADHPSVIIIGIDSMSSSNFIRQMPKTYKYMSETGFIQFSGHVKIHDNTYGNLHAILAGQRAVSVHEFPAEIDESWNVNFDNISYIWKDFKNNGYATLFAEDRPDIGTFNYKQKLRGFLHQPTDHYMRFITKYKNKRKFAFWWTQDLSHDYLNLIGKADDLFLNFLKNNEIYLNDSIIILLSDHGHRTDRIRETIVGRLESRLPLHAIRIPDNVNKKYPWIIKNLEENAQKITTHFDVHKSLKKIADGKFTIPLNQSKKARAYSYFDKMPKRLTCFEAEIPSDYCPCYDEIQIPTNDAHEAAENLVRVVNSLLESSEQPDEYDENQVKFQEKEEKEYYMCSPLELASVDFAAVRLPDSALLNNTHNPDTPLITAELQYRVVIKAKPSGALIEGLLSYDLKQNKWSTNTEVERNNRYGNSSFCVDNPTLKKICYCVPRSIDPKTPRKETPIATRQVDINMRENGMRGTEIAMSVKVRPVYRRIIEHIVADGYS